MKRFIYILFFAVVFSYFCSIRAEAVELDSPPMPNDYMSGHDTDKDEGFYEWLGDYATYLYLYGDKRDPADLEQEFKNCVHQVANQYGLSDAEDHINENLENISKSKKNIGKTLKDVYNVLNDSFSNWLIPSGNSSRHGSGFNPNDGTSSGGTSYPLSNGGQIVVNDFKVPQAPHSVDLYNDNAENSYVLLELLSYDKYGRVIDFRYIGVADVYASDTYSLAPFSFAGGIYEFNGNFYINYQYPYHLANISSNADGGGQIKVDVSATGGADPSVLPSIDPNGSLYYYPEAGWIDGRACIIGQDDDGNFCIRMSDDGSIYYPDQDGSFSIGGDKYYITYNYNTINQLHKDKIGDGLKSGAVYLTLLSYGGVSGSGYDYSVLLKYICDRLDDQKSVLDLMASDDFLKHIMSMLGLASGLMDDDQLAQFIPLLLSLSNKIVALLPYDCIAAAMADLENTLFMPAAPLGDITVNIQGQSYILLSASFAQSCQFGVDIVKSLCSLILVYLWLLSMRKKVTNL